MTEPAEDLPPRDHLDPQERDLEAPAADAVEQAIPISPSGDGAPVVHRGLEVDDWDAMEQAKIVEFDDEYR